MREKQNIVRVTRLYPCTVTVNGNTFFWEYELPTVRGAFPLDEYMPRETHDNCTVEMLSYPDGTCSGGWYRGEMPECN